MHRKLVWLLFLFLSCFLKVLAQDNSHTLTLSLKDALTAGLNYRYDVQAKQVDMKLSQNDIDKVKAYRLPQINANADVRYNTRLAATVVPGGFAGTGTTTMDDNQLQTFGTKNNTQLSVSLDQPLFSPASKTEVSIAKKNLELQGKHLQEAEADAKLEIISSYWKAIWKSTQVELSRQSVSRSHDYHTVAQAKYRAGNMIENDLLKVELDLLNAKAKLHKSTQDSALALAELKNNIGFQADQHLILTDTMIIDTNEMSSDMSAAASYLVSLKPELLRAQTQNEVYELYQKRATKNALPSISLYANYSQQFQTDDFNYTQNVWRPFHYVGLKISVPIVNQWKNRREQIEYSLKSNQQRLKIAQTQQRLTFEAQQRYVEMNQAYANYQTALSNKSLSSKILITDKKRFDAGELLYSLLLDTEASLQEANENWLESAYNFLVARARWHHALGVL